MNKSKILAFFILVISAAFIFAQADNEEIPKLILNNPDYLESVRLTEKAKEAYEAGDYDASTEYANQAAEYARRADAYVTMRLAENTLLKAHSRYIWADSVDAAKRYPEAYQTATEAYNQAQEARTAGDWDTVADAANRVLAALAVVTGPGAPPGGTPAGSTPAGGTPAGGTPLPSGLPAQYTVRDWKTTGDCFWNIAARLGVYGDHYQWRKLYEANKNKLPDPKNPNLIEPGTVLDIPSMKGEVRSGMWDPSVKY